MLAEWIRPQTSMPEVSGSNPSPAAVPLGKALYHYCLISRKGLKTVGTLVGWLLAYSAVL